LLDVVLSTLEVTDVVTEGRDDMSTAGTGEGGGMEVAGVTERRPIEMPVADDERLESYNCRFSHAS